MKKSISLIILFGPSYCTRNCIINSELSNYSTGMIKIIPMYISVNKSFPYKLKLTYITGTISCRKIIGFLVYLYNNTDGNLGLVLMELIAFFNNK